MTLLPQGFPAKMRKKQEKMSFFVFFSEKKQKNVDMVFGIKKANSKNSPFFSAEKIESDFVHSSKYFRNHVPVGANQHGFIFISMRFSISRHNFQSKTFTAMQISEVVQPKILLIPNHD